MNLDIKKDFSNKITNFLNKIQVLLFKLNSGSELLPKDIKSLEFLKYVIKVENEYSKSDATDFTVDISDDEEDESYIIVSEEDTPPKKIKFDPTTDEAQKLLEEFELENLDEETENENENIPVLDMDLLKKEAEDISKEHIELIHYKKHICWFNAMKIPLKTYFEEIIKKDNDKSKQEAEVVNVEDTIPNITNCLEETKLTNSISLSA